MKITNNWREQSGVTKAAYIFTILEIILLGLFYVLLVIGQHHFSSEPRDMGDGTAYGTVLAIINLGLIFLLFIVGLLPTYFIGLIQDLRKNKVTYIQLILGLVIVLIIGRLILYQLSLTA